MSQEDEQPRRTYRERREARAARLEGWAEGRSAKAEEAHARARSIGDGIPLGQPILVGHHSQRRHERDIERIDGAMRQSVEHSAMSDRHSGRAANIRAQLDQSIYDDDPDAIARLTERIAEWTAERDGMKARNARFRREHRDELKGMTAYQRDQFVPHPSWQITNLSANIRRNQQRLDRLKAR